MENRMNNENSRVLSRKAVRCAIYARTASCPQSDKNSAAAQQVARCRDAAQKNGWTVVEDCIRIDVGESGNTLQRRNGLQELMALAATRPLSFTYLICDSSDRLGRKLSIMGEIVDTMVNNGVSLHFASDGRDTADPHFREHFAFMFQVDHFRPKYQGKKTRRGKMGSKATKAANMAIEVPTLLA